MMITYEICEVREGVPWGGGRRTYTGKFPVCTSKVKLGINRSPKAQRLDGSMFCERESCWLGFSLLQIPFHMTASITLLHLSTRLLLPLNISGEAGEGLFCFFCFFFCCITTQTGQAVTTIPDADHPASLAQTFEARAAKYNLGGGKQRNWIQKQQMNQEGRVENTRPFLLKAAFAKATLPEQLSYIRAKQQKGCTFRKDAPPVLHRRTNSTSE